MEDFKKNCMKYNQLIEGDLKKYNELLADATEKRRKEEELNYAIVTLQSLLSDKERYGIFDQALKAYYNKNLSQFPKWSTILNISALNLVPPKSQKLYIETMDNLKKNYLTTLYRI